MKKYETEDKREVIDPLEDARRRTAESQGTIGKSHYPYPSWLKGSAVPSTMNRYSYGY